MIGRCVTIADERKQQRADRVDVDGRVERHAPQRRPVGSPRRSRRPRVRRLVHRQREHQHQERDENLSEVDVLQGTLRLASPREHCQRRVPGRPSKWASTASATRGPTTAARSSRLARRTPARLPKAVSSAAASSSGRCRAPRRAPTRSPGVARRRRWNVTAKRCASSRTRWSNRSAGLAAGQAIGSARSRVHDKLLLLGQADGHEVREPELLAARRRRPRADRVRRR